MDKKTKIFLLIGILLNTYFAVSQCSSGCTTTLTGNSTANITVSSGQTLCINATSSNILISHDLILQGGGTIKVCTTDPYKVTITGSGFSMPNAPNPRSFDNYGTLIFTPIYDNKGIEQALAIRNTTFDNQGHITFPMLQLNGGTDIQNKNTIVVNGSLGTNSSSKFTNTGLFQITGDADLNGDYNNSGIIKANLLTINAGGTVNISGGIFIANDLVLNAGTVSSGTGSSCAAFLIKNTTELASSSFSVGSGEVVIIDSTNIGSVDVSNCGVGNCGLILDPNSASPACFNNVLPLTWLDFQVSFEQEKITLYWVTAKEENVSHFEIESSLNGYDFEKIGEIGADNNVFNQYYFYDENINNNTKKYYRIKQLDTDGEFTYSAIQYLKSSFFGIPQLYPNPTHDNITVSFMKMIKNEDLNVKLMNYMGNVVFEQNTIDEEITLNLQDYESGIYVLIVQDNQGKRSEHRILKQ